MELKTTPLNARHHDLKARMAPFAGYEMPISYDAYTGGMMKEHLAVRESAGMFDVSHMGEFWVRGPQATAFLNHLCTRPFDTTPPQKAQYCMILNEDGFILDDIIVYKWSPEAYWVVVNAANIQKDYNHFIKEAAAFKVTVEDVSPQTALIAIQGPRAVEIISSLVSGSKDLKYYHFFSPQKDWIVARTGYTGEDGFEIFLPNSAAVELWQELEKRDVTPIGLGARDTLRLEVGFPLYGHELSETLRPLETFAAFAMDPTSDFLGAPKARLSPRFKPVALRTDGPKPIRADDKIFVGDKAVGVVTSGSMSPLKRCGMALGLVEISKLPPSNSEGPTFMLESGGKRRESFSQDLPFVTTARVKGRKPKG